MWGLIRKKGNPISISQFSDMFKLLIGKDDSVSNRRLKIINKESDFYSSFRHTIMKLKKKIETITNNEVIILNQNTRGYYLDYGKNG